VPHDRRPCREHDPGDDAPGSLSPSAPRKPSVSRRADGRDPRANARNAGPPVDRSRDPSRPRLSRDSRGDGSTAPRVPSARRETGGHRMTDLRSRSFGAMLRQVSLMARIWVFVSVLPGLLRVRGLPRLLRLCALGGPPPPADPAFVAAQVERVLARHPATSRSLCLKRSLALYRFLGGPATDLQVCFGVRYAGDASAGTTSRRLEGHAWLLRKGVPYLEGDDPCGRRFRETYRYPSRES